MAAEAGVSANEDDDDEEDEEEDDDADSFLAELESDPMSHVADYHFSEPQLDWIKIHYKHSGNFLQCHGLKPFEDQIVV